MSQHVSKRYCNLYTCGQCRKVAVDIEKDWLCEASDRDLQTHSRGTTTRNRLGTDAYAELTGPINTMHVSISFMTFFPIGLWQRRTQP